MRASPSSGTTEVIHHLEHLSSKASAMAQLVRVDEADLDHLSTICERDIQELMFFPEAAKERGSLSRALELLKRSTCPDEDLRGHIIRVARLGRTASRRLASARKEELLRLRHVIDLTAAVLGEKGISPADRRGIERNLEKLRRLVQAGGVFQRR